MTIATPAQAGEEAILQPVDYGEDMTTYSCRTNELDVDQGQNVNAFANTKTCPNAQVVSGEGETDVFAPGSSEQGYITRFKPSMVEVLPGGTVTPSVWDLHLHHVVWLKNFLGPNDGTPGNGPTFASGEEKTEVMMPEGYGIRTTGGSSWGLNHMIHNLTAEGGRQVYITWEIDWVPVDTTAGAGISDSTIRWMDVAGFPQAIYPVFDAEKGFDPQGDGKFTFPDDATNPSQPAFEEENEKIAQSTNWTVPAGGRTLVFGAGHLHPGGTSVDLQVARDGDDEGTVDGDDPSEVRKLFKSEAKYYEPAGPISWDVSMEATRPDWRISLKQGDLVSIDATYDVSKASWYESMGILPLAISAEDDPLAKDPFDDGPAVSEMYDAGGILTHGRLEENIDTFAGDDFGLPDPRKLKSKGKVPKDGLEINGFRYSMGGYSAFEGFPTSIMRPPLVKSGKDITFTSMTTMLGMDNDQQIWHSITSCRAPCNKGSGIGYPLANGPLKFDSGQLGYGTGPSQDVTTGSNQWTLNGGLPKKGKTYTYFCRIHPFMRGSIRTKEAKRKKGRD